MNNKLIASIILMFANLLCQGSVRDVLDLDRDWLFIKGDDKAAPLSMWQSVNVPHDWAIAGPFDLNEDQQFVKVIEDGETEAHLRTGRTGALPSTGIGWYRRSIPVAKEDEGRRIFLEFDGVLSNAQVYVNSKLAGERPYGYVSFCLDITSLVIPGAENMVEVRAENLPEMSRFYTGAGIYRPVRLVKTSPVRVAPMGIVVTTPKVTAREAVVNISATIDSPDDVAYPLTIINEIIDADGKVVASAKKKIPAPGEVTTSCKVRSPRLWSPQTPELYSVVTKIHDGKTLVD